MAAQQNLAKSRFINFCFTDFNTTDEHIQAVLRDLPYTYLIIGKERCKTTNREHLQAYCELSGQRSMNTLKKILGDVHIESRKGSAKQAADYCKKDGSFMEFGTMKTQGKRTDLDAIRATLAHSGKFEDVVLGGADLNQLKYAQLVLPYIEPKRDWVTEVYWFHGPTGTGKSRYAIRLAGGGAYIKDNTRWWPGYDGHDRVVIDELRPNQFPLEYILRLLDRYPFTVEYKGGNRSFLARKIWITCPMSPTAFSTACNLGEAEGQILRRITTVLDFSKPEISAMALERDAQ